MSYALEGLDGVGRFATRPDIMVLSACEPVLIIDTKWKRLAGAIDDAKRGVGQADVYQMMACAQVYRCARLMLLYPHHAGLGDDEGFSIVMSSAEPRARRSRSLRSRSQRWRGLA